MAKVGRQTKQKPKAQETDILYGRIPPQAKDLEEAVLGAILLERGAFDAASEIIRSEMFYFDSHKRIFEAMKSLSARSQPIDIHTVSEELERQEYLEDCGGKFYITRLTNSVVSSAHIKSHARIILQKFVQRELIRVGAEIIHNAYQGAEDPFDLLDEAMESFGQIGQALDIGEMVPIDVVLVEALRKIEEWRHQESAITGVASNFSDLDRATRGWQNGDLIILAARPSVGKTAFALNIVRNAAMHFQQRGTKQSVAVWSLEMKAVMLVLRMLAAESREWLYRIQTGRIDDQVMQKIYREGVQKLAQLKIFFDDKSTLTIQKLRAKARRMKQQNKLGLIVVDYLQLMTPEERSGNREQEVSKISRNLKNLAQELDVPIIALSQMSRAFESRDGQKRVPQLSDLRESGSLEQDADVVMFLWDPTDEEIAQDASLVNRRYLRIAKQRNGVLIKMDLDFRNEIQLFQEIEKATEIPGLGVGFRPLPRDFTESGRAEDSPF